MKAFPPLPSRCGLTPSPEGEGFYCRAFIKPRNQFAALTQSPKGSSWRRGSAVGGGEARNPPLWQIQADAAPMRQRVLLALASQNDYAEL